MIVTLTGLSGSGKSHFAARLAEEKGFLRFCCDDLIEKKLKTELEKAGFHSINGVAQWMGRPHDSDSAGRQDQYLACEREVMQEILALMQDRNFAAGRNVVIDTTGSVIYTGKEILDALRSRSRVVNFGVPECEYSFMYEQYLQDPKPVIWAGLFNQQPNETGEQALARCYPQLIESRAQLYRDFAHVTIMIDRENRDRLSVSRLLRYAEAQ